METLNASSSSPLALRSCSFSSSSLRCSSSNNNRSAEGQENASPNIQISISNSKPKPKPKPNANPVIGDSSLQDSPSHAPVQVVVRVRPVNRREREGVRVIHNLSSRSLSIDDKIFTFDDVLGPDSSQEDVFNLVGVPLVRNSLDGFNTSIMSYGETGSGKTYTMWGPPSAMLDCHSINSYQGLVPRIFHMLFSEIHNKQTSSDKEQTNYQCRCSFLEIYNEQINDLLDPTQRNLQMGDDAQNGFHVENLTEEYVTTVEDVTQILVKGLSNRKVGATSMNSKSSRSHIIFTCSIESWCKGSSSKCFSNSRTSKISLVDLAGSDRDKVDGVGRHIIKEGKHVKQSLSKLGKVVNILAEIARSGKDHKIPYTDSCLTYLLRDTLGGNSMVTFLCAIPPNDRHRAGTLSTLRFGERAKLMQNKAVRNEITEDHVNVLSDQIRQLKDELMRAKSYEDKSNDIRGAYFKGKIARESLNRLRASLNRSLLLPHVDNDSEEELDVDEDDVLELCSQLSSPPLSSKEKLKDVKENKDISPSKASSNADGENVIDSHLDGSEDEPNVGSFQGESKLNNAHPVISGTELAHPVISGTELPNAGSVVPPLMETCLRDHDVDSTVNRPLQDSPRKCNRSAVPCLNLPLLQDPPICLSPKIDNKLRKSVIASSSSVVASLSSLEKEYARQCDPLRSSLKSSKMCPTESLAASLHRGLQIIDHHQKSSSAKRSLLGLSFEHLASASRQLVDKVDAGAQTSPEDGGKASHFLCSACKKELDVDHNSDIQIVAAEDAVTPELCKKGSLKVEGMQEESQNKTPHTTNIDVGEREGLLKEIQNLKDQLKLFTHASADGSLLDQIRNGDTTDYENERQRWTESESRWISLTEELRLELESYRRLAEKKEIELNLEKKNTEELNDALTRSVLGHARIIEHYADLQELHNDLHGRHRKVMEGIAEVRKAASKAGSCKGNKAFASALAAELSTLQVERERERAFLKKQNKELRVQLRDTAEAVHAAGELLVRLREAEEAVSLTETKYEQTQQENEKLRKQVERMKKKHAMEMATMKHYLAESRLPESALEPFYQDSESESAQGTRDTIPADDQSWKAAFRPLY